MSHLSKNESISSIQEWSPSAGERQVSGALPPKSGWVPKVGSGRPAVRIEVSEQLGSGSNMNYSAFFVERPVSPLRAVTDFLKCASFSEPKITICYRPLNFFGKSETPMVKGCRCYGLSSGYQVV